MTNDPVAELLADPRFKGSPITWEITPEGYDAIRRTWLTHVQAEEVLFKPFTEEVFKAQMNIMLSVFTEDCVMELVQAGQRWQGREHAAAFYRPVPEFDPRHGVGAASPGHRPPGRPR